MEVRFREFDPFNCWIWLRFANPPGGGERGYVETALDSWFFLGKCGAFNAEALQVHEEGADLSWMSWDGDQCAQALPALMHNMSGMEYQGEWGRCWLDLGTSDALGLDVLANALNQLDRDVVEIELLLIHPKSAGHGLNLQFGGCKIIFLSMPWSLELFEQTVGRLHRSGQTNDVWCYLLICNKTIDERIWIALQDKRAISNIALEELTA
jgi:hypothetical protein